MITVGYDYEKLEPADQRLTELVRLIHTRFFYSKIIWEPTRTDRLDVDVEICVQTDENPEELEVALREIASQAGFMENEAFVSVLPEV